jgi:hypothetical protein
MSFLSRARPVRAVQLSVHSQSSQVKSVSIPNLETASASTCLLFSVLAPATSVSDSLLDYVADAVGQVICIQFSYYVNNRQPNGILSNVQLLN